MKCFIVISLLAAAAVGTSHRSRRAAYDFAAGVDEVVGQVRTTFQCPDRYGYFADVDNDCKVFHLCNPVMNSQGAVDRVDHYSFFCGNQTVFNQLTLTCSHPEEAVPCPNAPDFFYVNDNIGREDAPFLTDDDYQRGAALYPGYSQPSAAAAATTNQYAYSAPYEASSNRQQQQQPSYRQDVYSDYDNQQAASHYAGEQYPEDGYTAAASNSVAYSYAAPAPKPASRRAAFGQRIRH